MRIVGVSYGSPPVGPTSEAAFERKPWIRRLAAYLSELFVASVVMVRKVQRCDLGFGLAFAIEALRPLRSGTRLAAWQSDSEFVAAAELVTVVVAAAALDIVAAADGDDVGDGGCGEGLRSPDLVRDWTAADGGRCSASGLVPAVRMPV